MKTTIANLVLAPNSMQRTIYLASPYGFSEQWKRLLLPEFIDALTALGLEVWEPFSRNGQIDFAQPGWAYRVAQKDLQDVRDADALFAIVNGTPPDEGVMVELGSVDAIAIVKLLGWTVVELVGVELDMPPGCTGEMMLPQSPICTVLLGRDDSDPVSAA